MHECMRARILARLTLLQLLESQLPLLYEPKDIVIFRFSSFFLSFLSLSPYFPPSPFTSKLGVLIDGGARPVRV